MIYGTHFHEVELLEAISVFEQNNNVKVIAASIGGSVSIGLSNNTSDYDVYFLYENGNAPLFQKLRLEKYSKSIDCWSDCFSNCISECKTFFYSHKDFPTILTRGLNEKADDVKFGLLCSIFLTDSFFLCDLFFEEKYESVKSLFYIREICDYWYSRAYGNYYKFIKNHEKVNLRKYLYTVWQCLYMHRCLEEKRAPVQDFLLLLNASKDILDSNIEIIVKNLFELNKNSSVSKEDNFVAISIELDSWIEKNLKVIENKIKQFDDTKLLLVFEVVR